MELPIEKNVFAKTYNSTAYPLSILLTNSEKFLPSILNTYIQVIRLYDPLKKKFMYNFYFNSPYFDWNCFDTQVIRKHYFLNELSFFEKMVEDNMKKGFYIVAYVNEYHVEGRKSYQKWNFLHDCLVYGYDKNDFYILGYSNNEIYESTKINKKQYYKALFDHEHDDEDDDLSMSLFMIRPKKSFIEGISLLRIKNLLIDYIDSENNILTPSSDTVLRDTHSYGIQAFRELFSDIKQTNKIDMRFIRLFYEHKFIMYKRLEHIKELVELDPNILIDYKKIVSESEILFSLSIKNSIRNSNENIEKIYAMAESILSSEKEVLSALIKVLI